MVCRQLKGALTPPAGHKIKKTVYFQNVNTIQSVKYVTGPQQDPV